MAKFEKALMCVWRSWGAELDGTLIQEACVEYFEALFYRAKDYPGALYLFAGWSIKKGSYLDFSEFVRKIPKIRSKVDAIAKLFAKKNRLVPERNKAIWCRGDAEKAVAKTLENLNSFIDLVNMESGILKVWNRETGEDATAEFLKGYQFKNLKRSKNVEALAKEARVPHLYNVFLPLSIHSNTWAFSWG